MGRLGGLLQDLLAVHGRQRTAELLGVSERTLQRAEGNARLTEPLSRALQQYEAELPGSGELPLETAYELAALRRRVDKLERTQQAEQAVSEGLPEVHTALARLEASLEELRQQVDQTAALNQGGAAGRPAGSVGASVPRASTVSRGAAPHRRYPDYPELVTVEAEPEEERFYGAAMEAIAQWRQARVRRERAATTLERLKADERLLQLELELVEGHGLTLPAADRPWDGIRRQGELRVLDQALQRVRRERRRAQLVHWSLRLLTLGLWGLIQRLRLRQLRRPG